MSPLKVGEVRQLTATVKNVTGDILALTPGSIKWTLVDGASISLAADGIARASHFGAAHVQATVDGTTSAVTALDIENDPDGPPNVIDFDNLPAVNYLLGTTITPEAQLSTLYKGTLGVSFSSGAPYVAVIALKAGDAPSFTNGISESTPDGFVSYSAANRISLTFWNPNNPTVAGGTKSISVQTDNDGNPAHTVTMTAYDKSGTRVGQASTADLGGRKLTVTSTSANIHRVVLGGTFENVDGVSFDNVTFAPVVAAP
jgi:hypothetical protein